MVVAIKWNGPVVKKQVNNAVLQGIRAVTVSLYHACREAADVPNTGAEITLSRPPAPGERKRNKTQRTIYPDSSKPGEPPRRRTGHGQRNIVCGWTRTPFIEGRVGFTANARYMMFHELGIRYKRVGFQRRPTIVPTFMKNLTAMRSIFRRFSQMGGGRA